MKTNFFRVVALLTFFVSSFAFGQAGGPGPIPSPWVVNGPTIYYSNGGVIVGSNLTPGGSQGIGSINVSKGYYVNGVAIGGISAIPSHDLLCNLTGSSALPTGCSWSDFADIVVSSSNGAVPYRTGGSWGSISVGTSGATIPLNNTANIFGAQQSVNLNSGAAPTSISGALLNLTGADATIARVQVNSYGANAAFSGVVYGGTNASPTAVTSGTQLTGINAYAYNGASVVGSIASFRTYAAENISSGHQGSKGCIATTPIASTTIADVICAENDAGVTVGAPTGGSKGAGTLNATALYVNGTAVTGAGITAITGDVTATGPGSVPATISANAVSYVKFQQVAALSLVGNPTGSLANAQGITIGSTLAFSGTALQTGAGTGDVTWSANSFATTIAANAVTNAKAAQMAAVTLKGNPTASTANASDFTIQGLTQSLSPNATNDMLLIWDSVAGTLKKINPSTIASASVAGVSSIAGNTGSFTLSTGITNNVNDIRLASIAADNLLMNSTGSSAAPIATAVGNCATGLTYDTSTHTFGCRTATGTGNMVQATSPTLVTPVLGVATATSINKVAFTAPATGSTLTIADGKTATFNNSITFLGTDSTTMTLPSTSATVAGLGINQSFTAGQALTPTADGTQSAGGTLTMNFASSNYHTATFGAGNLTIANPSNVLAGQCGWLALTQDATGSRTATWGANFKWSGGTAPTLSTGANKTDLITWCAVSSSIIASQLAISNF